MESPYYKQTVRDECGLCLIDGIHKDAKHFCLRCDKYICDPCKSSHNRFSELRTHQLLPVAMMKKDCGLCLAEGDKKDAKYFCKNCEMHICDSCKDYHKKFQELRCHEILSGGMMLNKGSSKPCDVSAQFQSLSTNPSDATSKHNINDVPSLQEEVSTDAKTSTSKPSESTFLAKNDTSASESKSDTLLDVQVETSSKVNVKLEDDRKVPAITGCCFMPGGELVLCDKWQKILVLNNSLSFQDSLNMSDQVWDVAVLDSSNVVVTLPQEELIMFIQVLPSLKRGHNISTYKHCYGVDVAAGQIFVTCKNDVRHGEVRIYDISAEFIKRIGVKRDGSFLFQCPEYIAVSKSGNKIFMTDRKMDTVTCLTTDGIFLYQYTDTELREPRELYVDEKDNVIVCGWARKNVQIITSAGTKHKTLLESVFKSGETISRPFCVNFRPNDGTLVIGCWNYNDLLVYELS